MNWMLEERNYWSDPRSNAKSAYKNYDKDEETISFTVTEYVDGHDEDGNETEYCEEHDFSLPATLVVCDLCHGKGKYVNPSIDAGGLSRDDFYEDPGFAEGYFGGAYDVCCGQCHGNNVIPIVNEERLNEKQRKLYAIYLHNQYEDAMYEAECRAERMMGA